jgi:hypothetical protein
VHRDRNRTPGPAWFELEMDGTFGSEKVPLIKS